MLHSKALGVLLFGALGLLVAAYGADAFRFAMPGGFNFGFGGGESEAAAAPTRPEPELADDEDDDDDGGDDDAPPPPPPPSDDETDFMGSAEIKPHPREYKGFHPWHFNGFHNMPFDVGILLRHLAQKACL